MMRMSGKYQERINSLAKQISARVPINFSTRQLYSYQNKNRKEILDTLTQSNTAFIPTERIFKWLNHLYKQVQKYGVKV